MAVTSSPGQARQPCEGDVQLTGEALLRLGMRLYRLELEALDSLRVSISIRQYHILDRVAHDITSMTELANLAHRQPPTISRSVDSLVRQGLLARQTSLFDRRAATLSITPAGQAVLDEARCALQALSASVGASFNLAVDPVHLDAIVDSFYAATEGHIKSGPVKGKRPAPDPALRPIP